MGLPKYDTYDPTIKAKLCEAYINLGSMLKVGQLVGEAMYCSLSTNLDRKNYNISRQTVYNTLKSIHRLQPSIDRKESTPETLYIMADEKFVATQKASKSKVMVKHAVLFEGFSRVGSRNTLTSKPRCPMESHISHNLASIFTSRPKGHGVDNLKHYVSLRDLHLNNVDIQMAYLKTLHHKKQINYRL